MSTEEHFHPPFWLTNPHLQTLLPMLLPRPGCPALQRERWELADGDFIDLDWLHEPASCHQRPSDCTPLVVIFHGLEGCSGSHYVRGLLNQLAPLGWGAVVMHFRGCSGEPNRLARAYHSGETSDAAQLLTLLRQRYPHRPLLAVGYSLGANMLLKYLGEQGSDCPLQGAIAVCAPLRLDLCAEQLRQPQAWLYQQYLLRRMRASLRRKMQQQQLPLSLTPEQLPQLRDFFAYDNQVTAPLHGFADVHHYYQACSARQFLKDIRIPTSMLQAYDDPFMTPQVLPAAAELSTSIQLTISRYGGHIGFVDWQQGHWYFWLDAWIRRQLLACLA
ncbi:hydrolase [Balneatrix alpica]|uniref:hydrolase n=1 Tax=Balneatrix alpica TaxID=75684 RepID=UPI0027397751|nr:hydrolase [Balneatrix alpica]